MEIWKKIEGFEDYEVSNLGRVKSIRCTLKHCVGKNGYASVNLQENTKTIHRLVASAFIPNPENKRCVNHIDGNKKNNNVENLQWVTHKENTTHAIKNGLDPKRSYGVVQINFNDEIVKTYSSLQAAKKDTGIIHIGCVVKGHRNSAGGYKWIKKN